jgi:C4-dicarboxylate-specific signal transduction histidine kinase
MITTVPVDVGRSVRAMEADIRAAVGTGISVMLDVDPRPSITCTGIGDLEQMVTALVGIAANALADGGGTIRIVTGRGPCAAIDALLRDQDWALVVVADTGPGIGADADAKSELATIHGMVSDLAGHLDISSVAGDGTTVTIALPLYDAPFDPLVVVPIDVTTPSVF